MTTNNHITEAIPYRIGNPESTGLSGAQFGYDVAVNGKGYFLANNNERPYRRVTAKYRKDQFDQSPEAGEQSLTGWWLRSQSSFHYGAGIKYYEPSQDENLRFRYADSKGLDVWTAGQVDLLRDVTAGHVVTGGIATNGRSQQQLRSIQWTKDSNTYQGALLHDEYDIDKVFPTITASVSNKELTSNVATLTTSAAHGFCSGMEVTVSGVDATFNGTYTITTVPSDTTFTYAKTASDVPSAAVSPVGSASSGVIHFVDYNSGSDSPVYAVCDDGNTAYWVTNTVDTDNKLHVYKKSLNDSETDSPTNMFKENGIVVTNATMEYVKERIVMAANNKIYEFASTASALPTAVYTHPNTSHIFTSITASGTAIYVAGYTGIQSSILRFTLSTAGVMPTLTSGVVAAEMPPGEVIHKIFYYLGYMMIGTSKGIRVAVVSDDGSINYGPLLVETTQPCYDFTARGSYVWCATSVGGDAGLIRIDLGAPIGTLVFPYANDIYKSGVNENPTTSCAFIGNTDRVAFIYAGNGSNGNVYVEEATTKVESGYLTTGRIRYNTLEPKVFKLLLPRGDVTDGTLDIVSISPNGEEFTIRTIAEGGSLDEGGVPYPTNAQEYISLRFTLGRGTVSTTSPLLTGYQLKALPATKRTRLIQFPVFNFDIEKDRDGNKIGYEGRAYDRLKELEAIEEAADTVQVQDFRTGETFTAQLEELDYINTTPSDERFANFGGILLITVRTV